MLDLISNFVLDIRVVYIDVKNHKICDRLRQRGDRKGEGWTLYNIGTLNVERERFDIALAYFLLARTIFDEVQSPDRDKAQRQIDDLCQKVGEERFKVLRAKIEPNTFQIIEQSLRGELE